MSKNYRFIITGGGTSGHINPAISIADCLKACCEKNGDTCDIIFTGREKGLENELVPKAGYEMRYIEAKPFPMRPGKKLITAIKALSKGRKQCSRIIDEFSPDAVIGTGGYVCAPLLLEAQKKKVPVFLHESNAFPGRANKLLSKKANLVMTGFPNPIKSFPKAKKLIYTGNPIRTAMIKSADRDSAARILELNSDEKLVFVMGGSLGAKTLNDFALEAASRKEFEKVRFVLSAGKQQQAAFEAGLSKIPSNLIIKEYIDNPYIYMAGADVCITRAGAVTCAETAAVGSCSILVPYPHAAADHQTFNAKALESVGGAVLMSDSQVAQGMLFEVLDSLLKDDARREEMRKNAKENAVLDCDERVANAIFTELK